MIEYLINPCSGVKIDVKKEQLNNRFAVIREFCLRQNVSAPKQSHYRCFAEVRIIQND